MLNFLVDFNFYDYFQSKKGRRACLDDMEALATQNKQQLNEILKLASGRGREVVSTGRSGRLIQRRAEAFSEDEAGDTPEVKRSERLLQRRTEPFTEDDAGETPDLKHTDLNDNTSDETLSQVSLLH